MKKMGLRLTKLLALATLVLGAAAASGNAAGPAHPHLLGVVPHHARTHALPRSSALAAPSFLTFDGPYASFINQYFADVAHDSGGTQNVYSIAEQYFDGSGAVQYQSTFAGSYVDHDPLPANGCDDGADPVCLTDFQLQSEIQNVLTTKGWHGSPTNEFFLMTPVGVGSCGDASGAECSSNVFCAYHNSFTDLAGEPVIYANEPYEATIGGCTGPGQGFPNDTDADTTINTISHEHNESITDPFGDAWIASDGEENGDLCAYTYGAPHGTASNGEPYNQLINGHDYSLQEEWSNKGNNCFQSVQTTGVNVQRLVYNGGEVMHTNTTYAIYWLPTPGNTGQPTVNGTPAANHALTSSTGSWNGAATGYAYQWQRCSVSGSGCVNIPGATSSTYTLTAADGGSSVRSTVSARNVNGASPYAASTVDVVVPVPAPTAAPLISGLPGVGQRLSATSGSWNTDATFAHQWQRCAAGGTACVPIAGATGTTYVLVGADAGHVLRAVVTATNVAGTGSATSAASRKVVGIPRPKSAPRIEGRIAAGHRLTARRGTWTWAPETYRYQWLRCSANGGRCVAITKATRAVYRVGRKDAGHRLRLRVKATNVAGTRSALSRATKRVR